MSETYQLRDLLLPELEAELGKTRKLLERVPDGQNDFKSHEKSMPLSRLAGHTAELAGIGGLILTLPAIDAGTPSDPRKILRMTDPASLLTEYDELAAKTLDALKHTSDTAFYEPFTLSRQGNLVFEGTRYKAFRNISLNHMIHHRAQLGVYLRLLNVPVPGTFGPTADEK